MPTSIRAGAGALAIVGLLALPAAAVAGGWATVGLSSTPEDVAPGAAWNVEIEVLQHGRTPLDDVEPTVTISSGEFSRTFTTRPTGKPGTHRASVRFPRPGTWSYVVDDGFTARHSYPPVRIREAAATASTAAARDIAYDRLALAALAGLAAGGLALLVARGRRRLGAPAPGG